MPSARFKPVPLSPIWAPVTSGGPSSKPVVDAEPPAHCARSEEHTSELQSQSNLVCRLLLEKKKDSRVDTPSRLDGDRLARGCRRLWRTVPFRRSCGRCRCLAMNVVMEGRDPSNKAARLRLS